MNPGTLRIAELAAISVGVAFTTAGKVGVILGALIFGVLVALLVLALVDEFFWPRPGRLPTDEEIVTELSELDPEDPF